MSGASTARFDDVADYTISNRILCSNWKSGS